MTVKSSQFMSKIINPISVVIPTRTIVEPHINKVKKSFSHPKTEMLVYENNGEYSLPQLYNRGLEESTNNIVVFMHDDIDIETTNVTGKLNKLFDTFPEYGIIGLAGTDDLVNGMWWSKRDKMYGQVKHEHNGKVHRNNYSGTFGDGLKDVTKASALIVGASPVEELPIVAVYGVSKNRISNYKLKSGNYPNKKEVIVGLSIYDSLKNKNEVKIANETFKVSGVFKSQIGFENGGVVLNLDDASTIFNKSASMILVNAKVDPDIQTIVNKISKLSNEIEVKSTQNFVDNYNQFKIIKVTSNVIALIAFCMGLLGIVSMMSITINQRKSEFGIKRALGISMNKIINQILFESSILGFVAFISSFFLANIVLYIIKNIPSLHGYVNGEITTTLSIQVLVASILMAIIGSIIPALNASKTDPVSLIQGNRI